MAETTSSSSSKVLRTLLALVAAVALLGACGDDKKDDDDAKEDDPRVESPCELLDIKDLSRVTGVTFDASEPGDRSCTYTSSAGLSAIALNFVELNGVESQVALDQAKGSCQEGSIKELEFSEADGGFACVVAAQGEETGVATVAAAGDGVFAVLTGATLNESVGNAQILQDLATILENALKE